MSDRGKYAQKTQLRERVWNVANLNFPDETFKAFDIYKKIYETYPSITSHHVGRVIKSLVNDGLFLLVEKERRSKSYEITKYLKGLSYSQALMKRTSLRRINR